ncbi:MAG TPA: bifunctional 4-hydroxy-2-oxoglutarate aldolase/2-dehydro-3-deoxy-phosphogluconate aldolase [Mucilaginibacter sp.]|jgi:2-dehydro-3-deoxyphosphogluconate aldolase/(4S)-4-hydroxy-2-oxoglutarate aldolase|nr:bifunctional 4-hydroxy-2-oxoglutarate aldolase/2-dehydro-3-deoxy-phosphogluconate aldolase [Mucilaginibacter sp.]
MKIKKAVLSSILTQGMLPLFFYDDAEVSLQIIRTLYNAGIRVMEYTNRAKPAFENFKVLRKVVDKEMPDLYFGIGTIKNISEAEAFVDAGADFIVAPTINPEVAKVAHKHKLLWIPGCMTPTEIYTAQKNGAELIKIFPANVLGPGFISAVKEIFPGVLFMPTGGVELNSENINGWFNAGASAVGMGGKLISKDVLNKRLYEKLHTDTASAIELIKAAR